MQTFFLWLFVDGTPMWLLPVLIVDIAIGYHLSRVFAARMIAWDIDYDGDVHSSNDAVTIKGFAIWGGIFWSLGLIVWGAIKVFAPLINGWEPSIEKRVQKTIDRRKAREQNTLGKLTDRDAA